MNPSEAQALRDGQEAVLRNDFVEYFRISSALAHAGSALGQYQLGWCYQQGAGCTADPALAYRWWKDAALKGEPAAQYAVGSCLEHGRGVAADHMAALAWYSQAEAGGSRSAAEAFARLSQAVRSAVPNKSLERTREG